MCSKNKKKLYFNSPAIIAFMCVVCACVCYYVERKLLFFFYSSLSTHELLLVMCILIMNTTKFKILFILHLDKHNNKKKKFHL